ncbi:hypothetical protein [Fimbriiglobus ruber]|nr:hypothetical protein [Fimbriiglobus ruber]
MTESEWLACNDPTPMLEFIRAKFSDRKLRLFGVACCKRVWDYLPDPVGRNALEMVERAADGMGFTKQLRKAWTDLRNFEELLYQRHGEFGYVHYPQWLATEAVQYLFRGGRLSPVDRIGDVPSAILRFVREGSISEYYDLDEIAEQSVLSCLLREVSGIWQSGNPFRPVTFSPEWHTSTATALATQMYESRDFSVTPILADALQDAGCDNEDILNHLRGDGPHVRGCWALDLLLGKK